ncbi:MAG: tyrosine-type recombinase/integrase [Actinomycetota bacterium]
MSRRPRTAPSTPLWKTLGDFLVHEWLPAINPTVRATTYLGYRCHVERHIRPRIGTVHLAKVDATTLNSFYAALLAPTKAGGAGLSPTTVQRVHATIHRALRDAVKWGRIPKNPADDCDPPRERSRFGHEMVTWSPTELRKFLDGVRADRLYALWVLLATTGMRRGEALGLRWSDVDLANAQLAVRQSLVAAGSEVYLSKPKTARGRRVVALDERTVEALTGHRRRQERERRSRPHDDADLVFCEPDGGPLSPPAISKLFVQLVKEMGLPRIRLHDLRHTHATLALRAGIHPKIVSERLGHATVSMTLDVYSHAIPSLQKEAAARVADLVFDLVGGLRPRLKISRAWSRLRGLLPSKR